MSDFVLSLRRLYSERAITKPVLDDLLQRNKINGAEYLYITTGKEE